MNMEFLKRNFINTTTLINPSGGTATALYLFDRKTTTKFSSAATATVHFSINNSIDRIIIQETNMKNFTIQQATGTSLGLISGSDTTTAEFSSNSNTSLYLVLASLTSVNTITLIASSATSAGNIEIGQLWVTQNLYELERNPEINDFEISRSRKEYKHKLSDGGSALYVIEQKYFKGRMAWEFISSSATTALEDVYDQKDAVVFTPFPTVTSDWNGQKLAVTYEVIWHGEFQFDQQSDNDRGVGYSGAIKLEETAK